jgi:hypothetical protein
MAAVLKSFKWVPYESHLSKPPASNSNTLQPSQNSLSVPPILSSQEKQRHQAILSLTRSQAGAQRNAAAGAKGMWNYSLKARNVLIS